VKRPKPKKREPKEEYDYSKDKKPKLKKTYGNAGDAKKPYGDAWDS
jgi:hypothetical protein